MLVIGVLLAVFQQFVDDTTAERRWPAFCEAAAAAGLGSCLVLPLRIDRQPAGAVALYVHEPQVFRGAAHDIAQLFAAQGGTAVRNASVYRACGRMVNHLQAGLESRAVIEQAKGILHAELRVSPAEAFHLLSRYSQNTNRRVRMVCADLVQGRIGPAEFRSRGGPETWVPARVRLRHREGAPDGRKQIGLPNERRCLPRSSTLARHGAEPGSAEDGT
jgi:ANTAR domain